MTLTPCPSCSHHISPNAISCPECGALNFTEDENKAVSKSKLINVTASKTDKPSIEAFNISPDEAEQKARKEANWIACKSCLKYTFSEYERYDIWRHGAYTMCPECGYRNKKIDLQGKTLRTN